MKLMVDKPVYAVLIIAITCILQGCAFMGIGASDFNCNKGVDGVRCLSAREVYQATESSDYVKTKSDAEGYEKENKGQIITNGIQRESQVAVPRIEQPVPIRTQAKVMRIWMSPWEDDDGDLHVDGFMYTEIEGRKWNLGDRFKSPNNSIPPLSVATPSAKTVK